MWQTTDLSTLIDIIVAITAIYAAILSTWTFVVQQRANKPQVSIECRTKSYLKRQSTSGEIHRKPVTVDSEDNGTDEWKQVNVISVIAINRGQREVVLTEWGVMLPNKTILVSNEIRGTQAILVSARRFEREISIQKLAGTMPTSWFSRLTLRLVGFYRDELGNTYKSKRLRPDSSVKHILYGQKAR